MANGIRKSSLVREIKRKAVTVPYNRIADEWYKLPVKNLNPRFWDNDYTALPLEVWLDVLQYSGIDEYRYKKNQSDCDKFAMGLKAMTALKLHVNGIALIADYSAGHAYNGLLIVENGELSMEIVEPQSDRIIADPKRSRLYKLDHGDVIF